MHHLRLEPRIRNFTQHILTLKEPHWKPTPEQLASLEPQTCSRPRRICHHLPFHRLPSLPTRAAREGTRGPAVFGAHLAGHGRRRNALKHRHCRHVALALARLTVVPSLLVLYPARTASLDPGLELAALHSRPPPEPHRGLILTSRVSPLLHPARRSIDSSLGREAAERPKSLSTRSGFWEHTM